MTLPKGRIFLGTPSLHGITASKVNGLFQNCITPPNRVSYLSCLINEDVGEMTFLESQLSQHPGSVQCRHHHSVAAQLCQSGQS